MNMAETKKAKAAKAAKPGKAKGRPAAKPKAAPAKARRPAAKPKADPKKARRETATPTAGPRRASTETSSGFDITKLIDHPLVADLLAVGAMAAVAAIADHNVKTRTGEAETGSSKAVKAAGKAAATAIGKRLMTEVDAVRKASSPPETKRGSR
jgi:hypothetical protein